MIGQALRRVAPDFAIEDGYESAFAPGYDLGDFSDQIVDDYRAMTYTSYDRSARRGRTTTRTSCPSTSGSAPPPCRYW